MENMSFCLDYILKSQNVGGIETTNKSLDILEKRKFELKKDIKS